MHMNKHMCIHKHPHKHIYIYTQYTHVYIIHLISVHLTSNHLPFLTFAQAFVRSVVFRQLDRAGAVLQSQSGAQGDWRLAQAELGFFCSKVLAEPHELLREDLQMVRNHMFYRGLFGIFWHDHYEIIYCNPYAGDPTESWEWYFWWWFSWMRWSVLVVPLDSWFSTPRMVQRQVLWVSLAMSHVDVDFPGMVLRCAWLDQRTAPCTAFLRHDWRQVFGDLGVQIIDGHRKWFLSNVGKTMP